jgi:DNA-binding MarR family transcriptional regulator
VSAGSDARSHRVAITTAGRAKRAAAQPRWQAAQDALDRLLGIDEVRALHALVDRSLDRFAAQGDRR